MFDECPPPYSAVVATPPTEPLDPVYPDSRTALPFGHSDSLAFRILELISEGRALDSRFKDVRDVASTDAKFEYQEHALVLGRRFERLVWESRSIAGIALVAIKDFNEIVLDYLSKPNVAVQDRLKELVSTSKMLQQERDSDISQKSSFDALVKELEDFRQMVRSELDAVTPKKRRQSLPGGRGIGGAQPSRKSRPLCNMAHPEPLCSLSTATASIGAISKTFIYTLQFERIAEQTFFPSCVVSPPPGAPEPQAQAQTQTRDASPGGARPNTPERKRLYASVERAESVALLGLLDALVRDLRAFANRLDVFDTVFTELARAQDIFVVYLKDGQSVDDQGYRSEINRLRRRLPCVCNALDAYSKAKQP